MKPQAHNVHRLYIENRCLNVACMKHNSKKVAGLNLNYFCVELDFLCVYWAFSKDFDLNLQQRGFCLSVLALWRICLDWLRLTTDKKVFHKISPQLEKNDKIVETIFNSYLELQFKH